MFTMKMSRKSIYFSVWGNVLIILSFRRSEQNGVSKVKKSAKGRKSNFKGKKPAAGKGQRRGKVSGGRKRR